MPSKTALVPLSDIRAAIARIERYTKGKDLRSFRRDDLVLDAVERCLEIISEASRRLPESMKSEHSEIPWRKVAALGNVFRHEYDAVSTPMVWEIVQEHLPPLKRAVMQMLRDFRAPPARAVRGRRKSARTGRQR